MNIPSTQVNGRLYEPLRNPRLAMDLLGKRFSRLKAIKCLGVSKRKVYWLCRCDCGKDCAIPAAYLSSGHTKSCGCFAIDAAIDRSKTHGMSRREEHNIWCGMNTRCTNPNTKQFKYYGGGGISVCKRWTDGDGALSGFECFYLDMGPRPSKKHSIERKDSGGNYEPSNCLWATRLAQANNTRATKWVEWRGSRMSFADACRSEGLSLSGYKTAHARLKMGWTLKQAILAPPDSFGRGKWGTRKSSSVN